MEYKQIKHCNDCPNSEFQPFSLCGSNQQYCNWYCKPKGKNTSIKAIEISVPSKKLINIPEWCPCQYNSIQEKTDVNPLALINGKKYEDYTYLERKDMWEKFTPMVSWDEIEVGKSYHIPPFFDKNRLDIVIIRKSDHYIDYYEINPNSNIISRIPHTLYKNNLMLKFIREHKLKKVVIEGLK